MGGGYWPTIPFAFHGASWVGNAAPTTMGSAHVLHSSHSSLFHSFVAAITETTTDVDGTSNNNSKTFNRELRRNQQHHPSPANTPPTTRPAPHSYASLVVGTKNYVGSALLSYDVPQTFTPLGTISDSDIAKTNGLPTGWQYRLLYRNPISRIRSRKAQLFRERRERQKKSEP